MSDKIPFFEFDPTGSIWTVDEQVDILHTCKTDGVPRIVSIYSNGGTVTCEYCKRTFYAQVWASVYVEVEDE